MKYNPDPLHTYTATVPLHSDPFFPSPSSSSSSSPSSSHSGTLKPGLGSRKVDKRGRITLSATTDLSCGTCGKTFSRRDNLMTHQRVHTDERPYNCTLCRKSFRWMSALRHHQEMHRRRDLKIKQMQGNGYASHQAHHRMKKRESKNEEHILDLTSEFAQFAPDAFDLGIPSDRNKNMKTNFDINNTSNKNLHPSIAELFNQLR